MGYVYICMKRTDIPNGVLQITDLQPNVSQRNGSIDPPGQTKYINRRATGSTLAALVANETVAEYTGLAAYLLDHVVSNGGVTTTVARANTAAATILTLCDQNVSAAINATAINAALVAAGNAAGTTINTNGSNGSVADVLKIVAGAEYVLPSGSLVGGLAAGANLGAFTDGQYRNTYDTGAFQISFGEGQIAGFMSPTFNYGGNESPVLPAGAALVCYANDGTLYSL